MYNHVTLNRQFHWVSHECKQTLSSIENIIRPCYCDRYINADWYIKIDNSKVNAVMFIDLKTAFNAVDHDILQAKLLYHGINVIEHDWIHSYLNNRKQFCKVNGISSKTQAIEFEVLQG